MKDFNERTSMNERTHFFIKNIPITLYSRKGCERVDVGYVWEVSWRRGQTAAYWPKVLLTITALLSHLGWAAQLWITEGRKPSVCKLILTLASCPPINSNCNSNWNSNWLTQAVCGTWLYNCLTTTCFLWAYASAPNSTTSTGQGDIPIFSTGCTCFAVFLLIYLLLVHTLRPPVLQRLDPFVKNSGYDVLWTFQPVSFTAQLHSWI